MRLTDTQLLKNTCKDSRDFITMIDGKFVAYTQPFDFKEAAKYYNLNVDEYDMLDIIFSVPDESDTSKSRIVFCDLWVSRNLSNWTSHMYNVMNSMCFGNNNKIKTELEDYLRCCHQLYWNTHISFDAAKNMHILTWRYLNKP